MTDFMDGKEIAKSLKEISKEIREVYNSLELLVQKGKPYNEEFYNKLNMLRDLRKKEDEMYLNISKHLSMVTSILKEINGDSKNDVIKISLAEEVKLLLELDEEGLIKKRINNHLADLLFRSDEVILKSKDDSSSLEIRMNQYLHDDFFGTLIKLLDSYLTDPKYLKIKDKFLNTYFRLIFMRKNAEDNAIALNFDLPKDLYWDTPVMAKIYHISDERVLEEKSGIGAGAFDEIISNIVGIDDEYLDDPNLFFTYTLSFIIGRAAIMFMGKEKIELVRSSVKLEYKKDAKVEGESLKDLAKRALDRLNNLLDQYNDDLNLVSPSNIEIVNDDYEVNLDNETKGTLEELFQISKEIKIIYDVITSLEIVNKKESSEYKNALGKLKKLKLKEEKIYNLIGHDYAKINDMLYPEFDR